MPRKDYPPLAPAQRDWLDRWSRDGDATLARVERALRAMSYDSGHPLFRRVYAARLALQSLAAAGAARRARGIWTAGAWAGAPPELTDAQREHLAGIAGDAGRDLGHVVEFFDHAGCNCRLLGSSVRRAHLECVAIGRHLHRAPDSATGGPTLPESPPPDPAIDCGTGI